MTDFKALARAVMDLVETGHAGSRDGVNSILVLTKEEAVLLAKSILDLYGDK